jgi:hypothetical protein
MIHAPSLRLVAGFCAGCAILGATPAAAVDGVVLITQAKAMAGNVTPGDAPGFPVTLSVPGSYRLASDLTPGPGLDGIVTTAPDIAIDLNGFRISGGPAGGTDNALIGIRGLNDRLTVRNGAVGAFRTAGIYFVQRGYLTVENMRIINNGDGIDNFRGSITRIRKSTIATSQRAGVACGAFCHVAGSVVSGNGRFGISLMSGTVLGNTINSNTDVGLGTYDGQGGYGRAGFGNNTLLNNNNGGPQVSPGLFPLHPNVCSPAPC